MNLSFYIARRYLFSKKSHNAINIISMVSVCGVVVATVAMVCALSVFNGFNDLVANMFGYLDPELKITPRTGKVFDPEAPAIQSVLSMPEIGRYSEVVQENALIRYADRQYIGIIKGVDETYQELTSLDSVLIDGRFALREDVVDYATLGVGLAYTLGIRAGFSTPIEIYAPKRDERVNMANPSSSFDSEYAFIGGIFRINQEMYDDHFMIVPLELARSLFRYEKEVSSLEINLVSNAKLSAVKKEIREKLGEDYIVQDRYEQHEASFRMMQIEKAITYLILCFVLAIALFNFVGSLSMLMVEKQEDVKTLRNMGADEPLIKRIFLFEGWMISAFGAVIGIALGLILCHLQIKYGLIGLGQDNTVFSVSAYPVSIFWGDIILILVTVLVIGFLASLYPVHYLSKRWFSHNRPD